MTKSVDIPAIMAQAKRKKHRLETNLHSVHSSHGTFTIASDGRVIDFEADKLGDSTDVAHLRTIKRFNTVEYLKTYPGELPEGFDILDLGYWYTHHEDGQDRLCQKYEPPAHDWRKEHRLAYQKKEE